MKRFLLGALCGFLLSPAAALVAVRFGIWPMEGTTPPRTWETRLAGDAVHGAIRARAPRAANPLPPTDETLRAGLKLFRNGCAGCHGGAREPSVWGTRGFSPRVPQFGTFRSALSEPEMFWVVKNGIRYSGMGAWGDLVSDREIWQVVSFLSRLDRLPPAVAAEWTAPPR